MKKFIMYFLVFVSGNALSDKTVLAIVNNIPIYLNTIQSEFFSANSYEKKLEILNSRIDVILQLEKVNELDLWSTEENIDKFSNKKTS